MRRPRSCIAAHEADDKDLDLRYSLGFYVDDEQATIGDVIPRSPADAGRAPRPAATSSRSTATNGPRSCCRTRSPRPPDPSGKLTLLVQKDDMFKTLELKYSGGERYPNLVRDPATPDLLSLIAQPAGRELMR